MGIETTDIFINRELSWLDFNRRILDLGKDKTVPLGEQLKFLAIYASNLDEFFMVRVGSLYDRTLLKEKENKTGMTPAQQLNAIMPKAQGMQQRCDKAFARLSARIAHLGYQQVDFTKLGKKQEHLWRNYFLREVSPLLSPQIIGRRHPFPFLRNNATYIAASVKGKEDEQSSLGLIPINRQFQRIVLMPNGNGHTFALIEDLIHHFVSFAFGENSVQCSCIFRITRNADITVDEGIFDYDVDYRVIMSDLLKKRRKLAAVRLQLSAKAPKEIVAILKEKLVLPDNQIFEQSAPLDLSVGFTLAERLLQDGYSDLFYPSKRPILPPADFDLMKTVEQQDVLLYYPYQSMKPFIEMLHKAAIDPEVVSIKMTLYRVAKESKIIEALIAAAEHGKEIVAVVELRARFDEQNNIDFSKQLEDAGCTVIYGFESYKIHSKLTLITKKRGGKFSYISQIGTGNYNEKTSEQYTDLSYITTKQEIGVQLATVFHDLAVEQLTQQAGDLLVAPLCFKTNLLKEMDAEIAAKREGQSACIFIKCNSISDKDIIKKLKQASCEGVQVHMVVRGICCIKAGVPGLTENVKVRSIVGRYLEHERVYAFGTKDRTRVYIASGDFLTRNTQRRVEVGVCIRDAAIKKELLRIMNWQLCDNVNAREMQPDGSYVKVKQREGQKRVDCQLDMYHILEKSWETMQRNNRILEPVLLKRPSKTLPNRLRDALHSFLQ